MDTPERRTHLVDQYDAWMRQTIRRHGWALQAVLGDEEAPPFVYTVGLSGFDHPELVLFATSQATAATVLNDLGEQVRAGGALVAGQRVALPSGTVRLLVFPESAHWLLAANELYRSADGPPVPALLVVPEDELEPSPGADLPCAICAAGESHPHPSQHAGAGRDGPGRLTRRQPGRRVDGPRRASRSRRPRRR